MMAMAFRAKKIAENLLGKFETGNIDIRRSADKSKVREHNQWTPSGRTRHTDGSAAYFHRRPG
jgi:hypothetical protein